MDNKDLIEVQSEAIKDATAHIQEGKKTIRRLKIKTYILTGLCAVLLCVLGALFYTLIA